ncbi:MAG TPA: DUF1549 domain-containing protein, partial [Planctomycetaceae bacterium]|nr:DUF1549 domain-containing protein [Planctomycetaceae bacterium]
MDRRSFARYAQLFTAAAMGAMACAAAWMLPGAVRGGEPAASVAAETDVQAVVHRCDELIRAELSKAGTPIAPSVDDEDFLRRVSFDLIGRGPSPREVTLFVLDPDPAKRQKAIDKLVISEDFAGNWARYWREVIFSRATDARSRAAQQPFETWMTQQLAANRGWGEIATELITATGDVFQSGQTALMFAQGANAEDIAAETSRVFLGIQLQCANCHDHPTDKWTR